MAERLFKTIFSEIANWLRHQSLRASHNNLSTNKVSLFKLNISTEEFVK